MHVDLLQPKLKNEAGTIVTRAKNHGELKNEWIAVVGRGSSATEITGLCGCILYRLWVHSIVQKVG